MLYRSWRCCMVPAGEKGIFGGPYIFFHSGISNRETDKRMYGGTLSEKPKKNSKCPTPPVQPKGQYCKKLYLKKIKIVPPSYLGEGEWNQHFFRILHALDGLWWNSKPDWRCPNRRKNLKKKNVNKYHFLEKSIAISLILQLKPWKCWNKMLSNYSKKLHATSCIHLCSQ